MSFTSLQLAEHDSRFPWGRGWLRQGNRLQATFQKLCRFQIQLSDSFIIIWGRFNPSAKLVARPFLSKSRPTRSLFRNPLFSTIADWCPLTINTNPYLPFAQYFITAFKWNSSLHRNNLMPDSCSTGIVFNDKNNSWSLQLLKDSEHNVLSVKFKQQCCYWLQQQQLIAAGLLSILSPLQAADFATAAISAIRGHCSKQVRCNEPFDMYLVVI